MSRYGSLVGSCSEACFAEEKTSLLTALKFSGPFQKTISPCNECCWILKKVLWGPGADATLHNPTQIKQWACAKQNMVNVRSGKGLSLPHAQHSRRQQRHTVNTRMVSPAHHPHQCLPSRATFTLGEAADSGCQGRSFKGHLHKAVLVSQVIYNTVKAS